MSVRTKRRRRDAKLSDRQVRAAWELYRSGRSVRAIAKLIWQRWGYASPHAAAVSIFDAFRAEGFELRNRIEATVAASTKHGRAPRRNRPRGYKRWLRNQRRDHRPPCKGVRLRYPRKGAPCQLPAMVGSDYCLQHDPERRADVVADLERARAAA